MADVPNSSEATAEADASAEAAAITHAAAPESATGPVAAAASEMPVATTTPEVNPSDVVQSKSASRAVSPAFPNYTRNLLNVKVPVTVTLAAKKQPLKQILELAPGSLIQFDKSCDQTLELCVGDQCIAKGVAVKVGEKFGLRVNALTSPGERFQTVRPLRER
ncbi:MAG TPA: FliM/FliN family flagellar motor switch protein [Pirellulales bacterium]|jgi:flagellar motor switch/type III secretory pathway protein FliN|nr:FliM/FliN family flagellar motor switch protein [Pirellulales bacterium]